MNPENRIRRGGRWIGAVALVGMLVLGVAGCSVESAAQAKKAVGEEVDAPVAEQVEDVEAEDTATEPEGTATEPDFADTVDPIDEESTPDTDPPAAPKGAEAAEYEASIWPRIHLQIVSVENDLELKGETFKNPAGGSAIRREQCYSDDNRPMGYPQVAKTVKKGEVTHSCLDGEGIPELELTYSIPGVKDLLWIWVKIPDIGDNKLKCSVIDPGTWETNINSKYTCGAAWLQDDGHGRNPMPKVKLQLKKTEVVEDGGNAQEIMEKYCTKNQPNCDFTGAKRKLVPSEKSDWKVLDVYNNCGPDKKEVGHQTWAKERKFGWENSVGLSFEGEVEIPETKFNIGGEFELEGAWEFTNSYENEIDNPVPWGYANIFYLQVNYLEVTGDVDVVTKDKNYRLKNITYKLPLSQAWKDERGRTIPMASHYAAGFKIDCPTKAVMGSTGTKMLDGSPAPTADEL